MNKDTIKIDEIESFDEGVASISRINTNIANESENINNKNNITLTSDNFKTISSYLNQAKNNYNQANGNAKNLFLTIKGNGKLAITEGLSGGTYVNPNAEQYQVDFINKILPSALALYNEKGILPSLTIAQACKESAFGTARPGDGYNVFGIKASGWKGKTANARTGEQTKSGKTYYINADFRDYDSYDEAVRDYGEVLSLERYNAVRAAKDYKEAAHAVKAGGYATGVNYDNSLIKDYIEKYNLNQWDPVR